LNVCNVQVANGDAPSHMAPPISGRSGATTRCSVRRASTRRWSTSFSNGTLDFYSNESFRKTLAYIEQIADTGAYGDAVSYTSNDEAEAAFLNGDAAMYNFATSFVPELEESEHANSFVFTTAHSCRIPFQDKTVGLRVFGWDCYVGSCVEEDANKLKGGRTVDGVPHVRRRNGCALERRHDSRDRPLQRGLSGQDDFMQSIFAAIAADDVYSVPDLCVGWFDPSVKVPYRTAVTSIITERPRSTKPCSCSATGRPRLLGENGKRKKNLLKRHEVYYNDCMN
jgi:hypothetical protein